MIKGKYVQDCKNCGLMLAEFDTTEWAFTFDASKQRSIKCPRCLHEEYLLDTETIKENTDA